MADYDFGALNWGILIAYLAATMGLGLALGRRVHSANDLFLGQRNIPWWAIGLSVVATYVSALSFLGGPAWSYTDGLAVIAIHLNYPLVVFVVITVFLPFFYNSGAASIYDYLERRFGHRARATLAVIFLCSQTLTSAAILYATALIIQFITGMDVAYAIMLVAAMALVYTAMGGIAAVIWTDVIQAAILLVGALIVFVSLMDALPAALPEVLAALKAEGRTNPLDLSADLSRTATLWSGVIAMSLFHLTVYGASQMMVQRTLTARNIGDAKKSFLMMGYAAIFIYFLFFLLGILLYSHYEGRAFDNGNTIVLQFAADLAIPGLMGLIAAAVTAASMSSLDSALNSLATVSTVDFYQRYARPRADDAHYLRVSRIFTAIWALVIIVPALAYATSSGSILETLSQVGSLFVGAKLSMYLLGFFSRHTSERGLLVGVAAGFIAIWYVAQYTSIAWPWYCVIGTAVNMPVALAASLMLDGRQPQHSPWTVRGQQQQFAASGRAQKEGGWYLVPGRVDASSYGLLVFFVASLAALYLFNRLI